MKEGYTVANNAHEYVGKDTVLVYNWKGSNHISIYGWNYGLADKQPPCEENLIALFKIKPRQS